MRRSLVSLFAGAGGLDLGLEFAGFTTVAANELDPQACETLRRNQTLSRLNGSGLDEFIASAAAQKCFKKLSDEEMAIFFSRLSDERVPCLQHASIIEGDLRTIDSENFLVGKALESELSLVAGGPPCQPFSKAGKRKTLDCAKNGDLFYEFVRVVRDLRPRWFLFENVKGLSFTKTEVLYLVCTRCHSKELADFRVRQNWAENKPKCTPCKDCGSSQTEWVLDNERGGSLKIIEHEFRKTGYKCTSTSLNAADFGAPQIRERLFIVGSRDGHFFEWPQPSHEKKQMDGSPAQQNLFDSGQRKGWRTMRDALWRDGHWHYGQVANDRAVLWVKNVVRPHDEPVTWGLDRPAPTIGAHQGAKLAFAPEGVPDAQLLRQQWHTLGRRQGDTPPVFVEHRYLSDEELLRLQTFPRWWYLHGTRMQRAFQVGNAVPPALAQAVGEAIIKADPEL